MSATIQFRSDPDLDYQLDRLVEKLQRSGENASRSTVARSVLKQALGDSKKTVMYQESLKQIHAVVQRAANRAIAEVIETLPDVIDEEMR